MHKILNQKHDKNTLLYALSRMVERAGYYGLRGILILYLTQEGFLDISQNHAYTIYGWLGSAIVLTQIIGALFGDFLIGNKKAMIVGSLLQAIGAFCLTISSIYAVYAGLAILAIGSGLYTPNLLAHFGKKYLDRPKLIDSAFTGIYAAVNIGALIGSVLLSYAADKFGYSFGFGIAGILMLSALIFPLLARDNEYIALTPSRPMNIKTDNRLFRIFGMIMVSALFWTIYQLNGNEMYSAKSNFTSLFDGTLFRGIEQYLTEIIGIPLTIIAAIIWSKYYTRTSFKALIGIGFTAISLVAFTFISNDVTVSSFIVLTAATTLIAIAEILIGPLVFSTITKYTNPKYLALVLSVAFVPSQIFNASLGTLYSNFYEGTVLRYIGYGLLGILIIGVIIYYFNSKDGKFLTQSEEESELESIGEES